MDEKVPEKNVACTIILFKDAINNIIWKAGLFVTVTPTGKAKAKAESSGGSKHKPQMMDLGRVDWQIKGFKIQNPGANATKKICGGFT